MLTFTKPIDKNAYLNNYALDEDVMSFYDNLLKTVNSDLSLETKLNDLPNIFNISSKWNIILNERLTNAPSKELATELFKAELLKNINQDSGIFFNSFRNITYQHIITGQNITLQGLGYLILVLVCQHENGFDVIKSISNVFDVKNVIISLAEGVAIAHYLHNRPNDNVIDNNKSYHSNTDGVVNFPGSALGLKGAFKDESMYNVVIGKLIEHNAIKLSNDGKLIFTPLSRKNATYEAVSLFEALAESGYFKKDANTKEKGLILSETFSGWSLSHRIIGDKKTKTTQPLYEGILNEIKRNLSSPSFKPL